MWKGRPGCGLIARVSCPGSYGWPKAGATDARIAARTAASRGIHCADSVTDATKASHIVMHALADGLREVNLAPAARFPCGGANLASAGAVKLAPGLPLASRGAR